MKKLVNLVLVIAILMSQFQHLRAEAFLELIDLSSLELKTDIRTDVSPNLHKQTSTVLTGCTEGDFVEGQLIVTLNPDRSRIARVKKFGKEKYYKNLSSQMQKYLKAKINAKDLIAIRQQYAPIDYEGKINNKLKLAKTTKKTQKHELKRLERRTAFNKYLESSDSHRTFLLSTKYSCQELADLKQELENDPKIKLVRYNYVIKGSTNDTYFNSTGGTANWGFTDNELWGIKKIKAPEAWDKGVNGRNMVVAVIDSGLDIKHPDLDANVWVNSEEIAGNGIDDDRNGKIDDINGWDFVGTNSNSSAFADFVGDANVEDIDGHGTHVAGTIAAEANNNQGVVGVAYKAKIMPLRSQDDKGDGNEFSIEDALIYAANEGADVINMSIGSKKTDSRYKQEILDAISKNITVVVAAGNENGAVADYHPANIPEVITVGASTPTDKRAKFSNYGDGVDIAAPGGADSSKKITQVNYPDKHKLLTDMTVSDISIFPQGYKFTRQYNLIGNGYGLEKGFKLPSVYTLHTTEGGPGTLPIGFVMPDTYRLKNNFVIPANTTINARIFLTTRDRSITSINKDAIIQGYSLSYDNLANIVSTVPTRSQNSNEYLVFNGNTSSYHLYFGKTLPSHLTNIASIPNSNKLGSETEHGYYAFSGTSMASPHVAGVAALALSMNPDLSPSEVRDLLVSEADTLATVDTSKPIGKRVNALNVVNKLTITKPSLRATLGTDGKTITMSWARTQDGRNINATYYEYRLKNTIDAETTNVGNVISKDITPLAGTHNIAIRACNDYNCSDWSNTVSITIDAPLAAVTITATTPQTGTSVALSWNSITGASKYRVSIKGTPSFNNPNGYSSSIDVTSLSHTFSSLVPDTYTIKVIAIRSSGQEGLEATKGVVLNAQIARPTTPSGITLSKTSSSITASWTAVTGAQSYKIKFGKSGETPVEETITNINVTKSSLVASTTYNFQVAACQTVDGNNCSDFSSVKSETTSSIVITTPVPPAKPSLNEPIVTARSASISWASVTNAVKYQYVLTKPDGTSTNSQDTTSLSFTELAVGLHKIKVKACADTAMTNCSDYSDEKSFTIANPATSTISAPTVSVSVTDNQASIYWSIVTGATVYQYIVTNSSGTVIEDKTSTEKYFIIRLPNTGDYTVKARSCEDTAKTKCSDYSTEKLFTIRDSSSSLAVPSITEMTQDIDSSNRYGITLTVTPVASSSTVSYVNIIVGDDNRAIDYGTGYTSTTYRIGQNYNLVPGKTYKVMVKACSTSGVCSNLSEPRSITITAPVQKPRMRGSDIKEPVGFDVMVINNKRPLITWNTISGATNYELTMYRYNDASNLYDIAVGTTQTTTTTSFTWYQDLADDIYQVGIKACNSAGCSNEANRPFAVGTTSTITAANKKLRVDLNPTPIVYDITSNVRPGITWTPKAGTSYVAPVYYLIELQDVTTEPAQNLVTYKKTAASRSFDIPTLETASLINGHYYRYRVSGIYADGANDQSSRYFYADNSSTLPTSFAITSTNTYSINTIPTLTWQVATAAVYYDVRMQSFVGGKWSDYGVPIISLTNSLTLANKLTAGTYRFKVIAWNNKGSTTSSYKTFTVQ